MSDTPKFQTESYECSRQNASVKLGNAEWINQFSDGIELKTGDTVRLLGSFVHEGSSGEEIQISNDLTANVSFSPFIKANTFGTSDRTNNLIELKNISDIPYTSDAFGIEPPLWYLDESVETIKKKDHVMTNDNILLFGDPTCTGMQPAEFKFNSNTFEEDPIGTGPIPFYSFEQKTFTPGLNTDTSIYPKPNDPGTTLFDSFPGFDYETWSASSAPNEMYIGHMVKKMILPVFDKMRNCNRPAANMVGNGPRPGSFDERVMEDLTLGLPPNTIGGVAGMFAAAPRAGMVIATVNLGGASGFVNEKGECFWQSTNGEVKGDQNWNGQPNTVSGVESVVGTIIAARPIKYAILGSTTNCWEILVSDFINPAQIQSKKFAVDGLADKYIDGSKTLTNFADGPPLNTAPAQTLFKIPHGSGNLQNGYNVNPIYNNLNGQANRFKSPADQSNSQGYGQCSGQYSMSPLEIWNVNDFTTNNLVGSDKLTATNMDLQFCQPSGLSFLWCGSYTGGIRYGYDRRGAAATTSWLRTCSNVVWEKDAVDSLSVNMCITERGVHANAAGGISFQNINGSTNLTCGNVPVCLGAYVITTPELMTQIIKGEVDTNIGNNFFASVAGQNARVWFDYSFQAKDSNYNSRHYKNNSWNVISGFPDVDNLDPALFEPILQRDFNNQPIPGSNGEDRWGYEFCAQPLNINWRSSANQTAGGGGAGFLADGGRVLTYTNDSNDYPRSHDTMSNNNLAEVGEMFPAYYSTPDGTMNPDPAPPNPKKGMVIVNGGYNNCVNSIYFQDKETGDTRLGVDTKKYTTTIAFGFLAAGQNNITISLNSIDNGIIDFLDLPGAIVSYQKDNTFMRNWIGIVRTENGGGDTRVLFLEPNFLTKTNQQVGDEVIILIGGGPKSAGVEADPWAGDCILMKESMAQIKVPAGFYTEQDLGEKINEQLHFTPEEYASELGVLNADRTYSVPTTVGIGQKARASNPTIVNGNYLHSYLPDINYAFTPVTADNEAVLGLSASTKDLTNLVYTYEPVDAGFGNILYCWPSELDREYGDFRQRRLLNDSNYFPSVLGKHFKLYSIPHITTSPIFNPQIHLLRLKGGAYRQDDFDVGGNNEWNLTTSRFTGTGDVMRDYLNSIVPPADSDRTYTYGTQAVYNWKTRLNRNLFANGGSAKIFLGANNFTFEWQPLIDRFALNNLYTPFRPHESENQSKTDFGVDDAVPSAVISSRSTGENIGALSGIYINSLVSDNFTRDNWGYAWFDNYLYSTDTDAKNYENSLELTEIIGFSLSQMTKFNNQFNAVGNNTPFVFCDFRRQSGETLGNGLAIRVGAKIDSAINGTNPFANSCTLMAPIQQYFVQVLTDDFFAENIPTKGNDPYYFIGSDFPGKRFYGNDQGVRLPVIGICARNFHSFNFAFDLGSSAITYTVEEDITITSIRTCIYTSDLKLAANLQSYSSIIYIVEKNNFLNPIPDTMAKQTQQALLNSIPEVGNYFYNQPQIDYRSAPPPILPNNYKKSDGNLIEDDDDDNIDWD